MHPCVINVAIGSWYPRGQRRLETSLNEQGYDGGRVFRQSYLPGTPSHFNRPYAFKAYTMEHAFQLGYDLLIWLDASMIVVHSLDTIINHTIEHGVTAWDSGWALGQWTSDSALATYGINRSDAMHIPLIVGGAFAVSLKHDIGRKVFERYCEYAHHASLFVGPWTNENQVIGDPRCLGHRHDMPALTMACREFGANPIRDDVWFHYASKPVTPESVIVAIGDGGLPR